MLTWAMAGGHAIDADALSVILAAADTSDREPTSWQADQIWSLLWVDATSWCAIRNIAVPARVGDSLRTFLCFLGDAQLLDEDLDVLLDALVAAGGPSPTHRPRGGTAS